MFTQLARAVAQILAPLQGALSDATQLDQLLAAAGWLPEEAVTAAAVDALDAALGIGADLETLLGLTAGDVTLADALDAIAAGGRVLQLLTELAAADPAAWEDALEDAVAALPAPFFDTESVLLAVADIGAVLTTQWLATTLPVGRAALRFAGVLHGTGPERLDWSRLIELVSDPVVRFADTYGWGERVSLTAIDAAARAVGDLATGPLRVTDVDPVIAARYWGAGVAPPDGVRQYALPIIEVAAVDSTDLTADVALVVVPVPDGPNANPAPTGLLVAPVARAGASVPVAFGDMWSAVVSVAADLTGTEGLTIRPSPSGGVVVARETGAPDLDLAVTFSAPVSMTLGDPDGTRVDVNGLEIELGIAERNGGPEPFLAISPIEPIVITLAPPDLGGFLRFLLGDGIELDLAVDVDISTSGVRIGGALGLAFTISVNQQLAIVHLDLLDIALVAGPDSVQVTARIGIRLELGPIRIEVGGLGAALTLRMAPNGDGTLGELDVRLELLAPTRLVIVVESDAVNGGGFVDYDPATGRYTGGLAVDLFGLGITALVVVDTMIPGDPDAWALFASLGATFPTPIPLGFGFTLVGVGGVLALDRTMDAEALATGLRNGVVDSLLFPEDVFGDSVQLLDQIDDYFPLLPGNTVVGPVVMLGWGSPTLITAQLGVLISLPDGVIAVLGSVEALLPVPDAPLLTLHMDTLGVVDVAAGTFSLTASLYDSHLLSTIDLGGDMAMYLSTSAQPYFLLSVGGYHPSFHPPSTVPAAMHDLRRMSASIVIASVVTVTVEAYFAVTSNTVQFGASVNLEASVEVWPTTYTARGWFEFDVLLIFSPFRIVADMAAGVGIYAGGKELMGVDLAAHLDGPEPWFASGHASFKFFGLKVAFELEVGGRAGGEPPPIAHPRADVLAALALPSSWSEAAPIDGIAAGLTYLTPTDDDPDVVWIRPDHQLMVRQSVAPLDRLMEIVGQAVPAAGEELLHITEAAIGDETVTFTTSVDWFAPAQFEVLGRAEKLSRASFEEMNAGVTFGLATVTVTSRAEPAHHERGHRLRGGRADRFGAHRSGRHRPPAAPRRDDRGVHDRVDDVHAGAGDRRDRGDAGADRQRRGEWRGQSVRGDDGPGGTDRSGPRRAVTNGRRSRDRRAAAAARHRDRAAARRRARRRGRPTTMTASLYFLPWLRRGLGAELGDARHRPDPAARRSGDGAGRPRRCAGRGRAVAAAARSRDGDRRRPDHPPLPRAEHRRRRVRLLPARRAHRPRSALGADPGRRRRRRRRAAASVGRARVRRGRDRRVRAR